MTKRKFTWLQVGEQLLNKRWWLVVLASLSVFLFEFIEYQPFLQGISSNFFFEIIFYGIALPLSVGIALSWAAASRAELAWSTYYQDLIPNLSLQLHSAHTYNELASIFLQFIKVVVPLVSIAIYKNEPNCHTYKTILNWSLNNDIPLPDSNFACTNGSCPFLTVNISIDGLHSLQLCRDPKIALSTQNSNYFCLPFLFSNELVAGARLYLPPTSTLSPEQIRLLKEVAPIVASSFHRIQLEQLMKTRDDSINAEQNRIARDVHDALGHNLAYLRLRLDQISMEFDQSRVNNLHHEVEALRDAAKEAYDQMRDVLTTLTLPSVSSLSDALQETAERMTRRGNLRLKIHHEGQPHAFSPIAQRTIFYMIKETLTNIEKHAQAQSVSVDLEWKETGFVIDVCDDGIGFDRDVVIQNGHFGLKNIKERAHEIDAQLDISSQPGHGTRLTFHIPYRDES
jgi:signal transduction histidine kinase